MSPPEPHQKIVRQLRDWEIAQAHTVFGDTIKYAAVRVHEGVTWADTANQLGTWVKRIPPPTSYTPNAITIRNHCCFPLNLPGTLIEWDQWRYSFGWLIHELTHVWQFQHDGWSYLFCALTAQFSLGARVYDFGNAEGLATATAAGKFLSSFNPEQQGAIMQTYYDYRNGNRDVSAWTPFVNEIQGRA